MNHVICITGKMASGKNYICSQYEKDGWKSIDLDKNVHVAIKNQTPKILQTFEEDAKKANVVLQNPDGSLNRRELGKLVFSNAELLKKQENIVYPEVISLTKKFIEENPDSKIIINATVLFKTPELLNLCSEIHFVTAPFFTRLKRAKKRDNLPCKQILKRFWNQRNLLNEYTKTAIPITIINNK